MHLLFRQGSLLPDIDELGQVGVQGWCGREPQRMPGMRCHITHMARAAVLCAPAAPLVGAIVRPVNGSNCLISDGSAAARARPRLSAAAPPGPKDTSKQRATPPLRPPQTATWDVESSKKLYNTLGWGHPYFSINSEGNLVVRPTGVQERVLTAGFEMGFEAARREGGREGQRGQHAKNLGTHAW